MKPSEDVRVSVPDVHVGEPLHLLLHVFLKFSRTQQHLTDGTYRSLTVIERHLLLTCKKLRMGRKEKVCLVCMKTIVNNRSKNSQFARYGHENKTSPNAKLINKRTNLESDVSAPKKQVLFSRCRDEHRSFESSLLSVSLSRLCGLSGSDFCRRRIRHPRPPVSCSLIKPDPQLRTDSYATELVTLRLYLRHSQTHRLTCAHGNERHCITRCNAHKDVHSKTIFILRIS